MMPGLPKLVSNCRAVLLGLLFFAGLLFFPVSTEASIDHNVRGHARLVSDSTYISFNCVDDNGGGRFPFNFPIHFSASGCLNSSHGVNIDSQGNFSGKAWHYSFGDINFEISSSTSEQTPNNDFRANCPNCLAANGCSACLVKDQDGQPGTVYGYARVASFATSSAQSYGWIKLDGILVDSFLSSTGGGFHGVISAANTPASIGAIEFDCHEGVGTCSADPNNLNWHTYVWSLWVGRMTAPNWPYKSACDFGAIGAVLKWQLSSGTQKKWQVIINDSDYLNTSTPLFTTGSYGSANSYSCLTDPQKCHLFYDQSYYWWVKLWYSFNDSDAESAWLETPWIQFNHTTVDNIGKIVEGESAGDKDFRTYKNEFPTVYGMSATPTTPVIGSSSEFTAFASYTLPDEPTVTYDCDSSACHFTWSSSDSNAIFSPWSSYQPTTSVYFVHPTGTMITARVTDQSGYFCKKTTSVMDANFMLPLWREVKVKKNAN